MKNASLPNLAGLLAVTDEQAMWRVKMDDDNEAFARLMDRWGQPIRNLCTRMTGDAHRAEDLAQETFARVYAKRQEYEPSGRFSTYLWRIALNLCHDELRRPHRRWTTATSSADPDGIPEEAASEEPGPAAIMAARENADAVKGALLDLSESHRAVLVLRHYENLKFREIAAVLGIPEGTVKSRMAEALIQLAGRLAPVLDDRPAMARPIREGML